MPAHKCQCAYTDKRRFCISHIRLFERLRTEFDRINRENGTHTELVPYFISSHPGRRMVERSGRGGAIGF